MADSVLSILSRIFTIDKFHQSTCWTPQGSARGLSERVMETVNECLRNNPESGVIAFERLQDGGYEIKGFRTR